jgi:hypothetical protein
MFYRIAREKSSRSGDSFDALRDEKNRQVCLMNAKEIK